MWNTCELNKEYEFNNIDNNDYDNDNNNNDNNDDDNIVHHHPLIDDVVSIDRPELVESGLSLNSSTVAKVIIVAIIVIIVVIIVIMVIITIVIIMAITIIMVIMVIIIIMILYDVRLNWPAVALEEPEFDASSQFQTGQSSS